jgi:hypothetical protein
MPNRWNYLKSIATDNVRRSALRFIGKRFCSATRGSTRFTGGRKVIDVSGDGDDNQGIAVLLSFVTRWLKRCRHQWAATIVPPEYIFRNNPPRSRRPS